MRVLLTVQYDGTNYCGWQRQHGQITIQQIIEDKLSELYGTNVIILGASRTDSGVHALGQRASFTPPDNRIPVEKLYLAINSRLPRDIRVLASQAVPDEFHVINSVKQKTYAYRIQNTLVFNPILYRYTHHIKEPLDTALMNEASGFFCGEHDFKAFCAAHSGAVGTVRTVFGLSVKREDSIVTVEICGGGFLYNMVRIIAGTLADVGIGKTSPSTVAEIIKSGRRERAGATLPAKGLTLLSIEY